MKTQSFVRRVLFVVFFAVIAAFFVASSVIASDDILPTWRSVTGKFSVEASLVRVTADSAVLKREDGSEMLVPLEKLDQPSLVMVLRFMNGNGVSQPQKPKSPAKVVATKSSPVNKAVDDMFNVAAGANVGVGDFAIQNVVEAAIAILPKTSGTDIQKQAQLKNLSDELNRRFKGRKCVLKFKVNNVAKLQNISNTPYVATGDFVDRKWAFRMGYIPLSINDVSSVNLSDIVVIEGQLVTCDLFNIPDSPIAGIFFVGTHYVTKEGETVFDRRTGISTTAVEAVSLNLFKFSQRIEHAKK